MFPNRYFAGRYFADRYWPIGDGITPIPAPAVGGLYGRKPYPKTYFLGDDTRVIVENAQQERDLLEYVDAQALLALTKSKKKRKKQPLQLKLVEVDDTTPMDAVQFDTPLVTFDALIAANDALALFLEAKRIRRSKFLTILMLDA